LTSVAVGTGVWVGDGVGVVGRAQALNKEIVITMKVHRFI